MIAIVTTASTYSQCLPFSSMHFRHFYGTWHNYGTFFTHLLSVYHDIGNMILPVTEKYTFYFSHSSKIIHLSITIFLVYSLSPLFSVYRYIPDDTCRPCSFLPSHATLCLPDSSSESISMVTGLPRKSYTVSMTSFISPSFPGMSNDIVVCGLKGLGKFW